MSGASVGTTPEDPTLRSLTRFIYIPALLFSIGQGAVIPVIPLTARHLGASVAIASVVSSLRGGGTMLSDLPTGGIVARLGERSAMVLGGLVLSAALTGAVLSTSTWSFALSIFAVGCGWALMTVARLSYVSATVPYHLRGRALATLGGLARLGSFPGPFLGALVARFTGIDGAFYLFLALSLTSCTLLAVAPAPTSRSVTAHVKVSILDIGRQHRSIFLTAGVGAMLIGALRAARQVVLPLWGAHLGLDASAVGVVYGVSSAVDFALFYPSGMISDRWGRKWVSGPTLLIMGLGIALVPLSHSFLALLLIGLVSGFGNGLGSGIVMTLGADYAPPATRAGFLGVWRFVADSGAASGPLLIAGLVGLASLAVASFGLGAAGLVGTILILTARPPVIPAEAQVQAELTDSG